MTVWAGRFGGGEHIFCFSRRNLFCGNYFRTPQAHGEGRGRVERRRTSEGRAPVLQAGDESVPGRRLGNLEIVRCVGGMADRIGE